MAEVKKTKATKTNAFLGTGSRKKATARVRLIPGGNGVVTINKQNINEYFKQELLRKIALQPLVLTGMDKKYDVAVNVKGGGFTGQAGAVCHGIARSLVKSDETLRPEIKKAGFLTRDSRMKERKKYGLKKARKAPQFSKR
ncbi:MAG: 30S ribosomal protein S9 [Clostridia bacterium]|nr:30S ribosomal protein S9 [Clostridia bacterium]